MIVNQQELIRRLGVCPATVLAWTRKGYFGDVPKAGHPLKYQYDLAAVKTALEARKIRVAVGAFDDLATAKPKTKAKAK